MADDDLTATHLVVPRKWMVAVLGAVFSAIASGAGAIYKYGSVEGQLAELRKHCLKTEDLADVPPADLQAPSRP